MSVPKERFQSKIPWIGSEDEPLTGFSWRAGSDRDTTGILMWSDIFLCDNINGDNIGVILMDTQGLFDNESTTQENTVVFAISTFLSSVQILNLKKDIQENDLQNIQFAIEYAKCYRSSTESQCKPFQHLWFLVRDWFNVDEYSHSRQGGKKYLKDVLAEKATKPELNVVRNAIKSSFENLECYLMPYPGRKVVVDRNFSGQIKDIERDFIDGLKNFIPEILAPRNLVVKASLMQPYTANDFLYYFKSFEVAFDNGVFPTVKSYHTVVIHNHYHRITSRCASNYRQEMINNIQQLRHRNERTLQLTHNVTRSRALTEYQDQPRMGSQEDFDSNFDTLNDTIDRAFAELKELFHKSVSLNVSPQFLAQFQMLMQIISFILMFLPIAKFPRAVRSFLTFIGVLANRSRQPIGQ